MASETFSVEEKILEDGSETRRKRGGGYYCSLAKLSLVVLIVIAVIIITGLVAAYYGPGRKSYASEGEGVTRKLVATTRKHGTTPTLAATSIKSMLATSKITTPPIETSTLATTTTVATTTATTTAIPDLTGPFENIRLPSSVKPIHYNVFLDVNMETRKVNGTANVTVNVATPTNYLLIHAYRFQTLDGKVVDSNKREVEILRQFEYVRNQYHVIELKSNVTGSFELRYEFSYKLRENLAGFYEATYKVKNGEEKLVAATQFQPVDARTAFPCFDEPAQRATFNVTLGSEKTYTAISNMPVIKTWYDKSGERQYFRFAKTPSIPTYLLAFVICDFGNVTVTAKTKEDVKMTFYAPREQINQISYAVDVGSKILPFFEDYYNVSYPLPKSDMIALPDFEAGAMENWGLITYRLKGLLYDEQASSISNKRYIASIISHELAHQWFGNLVTMDWWSDLWLNEGFATYVAYLGVDAVHPDWNYLDFQVVRDMVAGMELDSLLTSHPIYIEVNHPSQISEIFDSISYSKGACLLRMLDNFMGTANFVKGLSMYLRKYSYGTAKTQDLWEELSKASALAGDSYNISKIMNTWVLQMGFPVINVNRQSDGTYKLIQSRFLKDIKPDLSKSSFASPYGYKWVVPFNYVTLDLSNVTKVSVTPVQKVWMNMGNATIKLSSNSTIIKGNAGQYGFFRVNYDTEDWKKISEILKASHKVFDLKDRAGLLMDAFSLANSGRLNYTIALDLFDYVDREEDYIPWKAASTYIPASYSKSTKKLFQKYLLTKVSNIYEKYGFKPVTKFLSRQFQRLATYLACHNRHKGCLQSASDLFNDWMNNGKVVTNDLRSLVYFYGVYNGGDREWNFVFNKYLHTQIASEKPLLLYALCASQQSATIDKLLHFTLNSSIIKSQDVASILSYVANVNPIGRYHAWYFLKEQWDVFTKRFANSFFSMRRIIGGVTGGFTTEYALNQVRTFFDKKKAKSVIAQRTVEKIQSNIAWIKSNEVVIEQWLKSKLNETN